LHESVRKVLSQTNSRPHIGKCKPFFLVQSFVKPVISGLIKSAGRVVTNHVPGAIYEVMMISVQK